MIERSISQAKADLSRLVDAAIRGEEVILERLGKPIARIVPFRDRSKTRAPGGLEGVVIPDDFNDPDPEIIRMFEGDDAP